MDPDDNDSIPEAAKKTDRTIRETGKAPKGQRGGQPFRNDKGLLPKPDLNGNPIRYKDYKEYKEWHVNPKKHEVPRGSERIVTGSDGSMYYTPYHYETFIPME